MRQRGREWARTARAVFFAAALVALLAPPLSVADAQTTTTTPTTVPAVPEPTTTTTVAPVPGAAPGEAPPGDEVVDVPTEAPPTEAIDVPPPAVPTPPTAEQDKIRALIEEKLARAAETLVSSIGTEAVWTQQVAMFERQLAVQLVELDALTTRTTEAKARLADLTARMRRVAVEAYVGGGSLRQFQLVLVSENPDDLPRRMGLARGAFGSARANLRQQAKVVSELQAQVVRQEAAVVATRQQLDAARWGAAQATGQANTWRGEVVALAAGHDIAVGGLSFPVLGATRFSDSFGAPRMTGTSFAHAHQGVDIFAPLGTPLRAFERGVLTKVGTDILGGNKLWLVGQSGTRYYYAHLQGFAPGIAAGMVVDVGQVVGFAGTSGNAAGTPPHLHFEIHPGGGAAVNPYPILRQIVDATAGVAPAPVAPA